MKNAHVVRNGWLGDVYALLDVAGAQARFLAQGAGTLGLEGCQDFAAGGVGDGMKQACDVLVVGAHGSRNRGKIDGCQCEGFAIEV
jgi:hypothetical protein